MVDFFSKAGRRQHRKRINAGLVKARADGKRLGRPPLSPKIIAGIYDMSDKGDSTRKIGRALKISHSAVGKILRCRADSPNTPNRS